MKSEAIYGVTNVLPVLDEFARELYSQEDDDTGAIKLFMVAQPESVEE